MASIFTHAYVGYSIYEVFKKKRSKISSIKYVNRNSYLSQRNFINRTLLICVLCSILPDLDVITFPLGIPYDHWMGHRGFIHSILFSLLLGLSILHLFYKRIRPGSRIWKKLLALFFMATLSHAFLDALTNGGLGVAFFAPFYNKRYFFPMTPIEVSPIGILSFFSIRGLEVILSEMVFVFLPVFLFKRVYFFLVCSRQSSCKSGRRKYLRAMVWPALLFLPIFWSMIKAKYPKHSVQYDNDHGKSNVIEIFDLPNSGNHPSDIPIDSSRREKSDSHVVTDFDQLNERQLFNKRQSLNGKSVPWPSSFFPRWYGGIAGRWQEPRAVLALRSLFGYAPPSREEAIRLLNWASMNYKGALDILYKYSPTEKFDLAMGDYMFKSTIAENEKMGHNTDGYYEFWTGLCDGVSIASIHFEEPKYEVTVINSDGLHIRFHPNDIKALLIRVAASFSEISYLGERCNKTDNTNEKACRDINPGILALALANKVGIEGKSFILEIEPFEKVKNYPVKNYLIEEVDRPRPVIEGINSFGVPREVKYLVNVKIHIGLSDSNMRGHSYIESEDLDARKKDFELNLVYPAQLALDENRSIIGGKWLSKDQGPDFAWFIDNAYLDFSKLNSINHNPHLDWGLIKSLHDQSILENTDGNRIIDLRKAKDGIYGDGTGTEAETGFGAETMSKEAQSCEEKLQAEDCNSMGIHFEDRKDLEQAMHYFLRGCNLDSPHACYNRWRIDTKVKQESTSFKHLLKACELKMGFACYLVGKHFNEKGNPKKAKTYFMQGCGYGNNWSCLGEGEAEEMEKFFIKARKSYKKSCELGLSFGCLALGRLYEKEKDSKSAKEYYRQACDLDNKFGCEKM